MNQGILVVQEPFGGCITDLASLDLIRLVSRCPDHVLYNFFPSLQEF